MLQGDSFAYRTLRVKTFEAFRVEVVSLDWYWFELLYYIKHKVIFVCISDQLLGSRFLLTKDVWLAEAWQGSSAQEQINGEILVECSRLGGEPNLHRESA